MRHLGQLKFIWKNEKLLFGISETDMKCLIAGKRKEFMRNLI